MGYDANKQGQDKTIENVDVNLDLGGNTLTFNGTSADTNIIKSGTKGCLIVGGTDSNVTISNGTIVNEVSTDTVYAVVGIYKIQVRRLVRPILNILVCQLQE